MLQVKWCGIDFGQCLMEPTGLRTYLVIGDVYKEAGKPEGIPEAVKKFREVVEAYGGHSPLKESHRDKIHTYVFNGDDRLMEIFSQKEKEHLSVGVGAEEALKYLNEEGIDVNIVAELKKTLGAMGKNIITNFLNAKNLIKFFHCLYTPQGKMDLSNGSIDESYIGRTKESGALYEKLVEEIGGLGIKPSEMLMVGDKIATDINPPHRLGIKTVQYTGYIDMGPSDADYRVSSFSELKDLIQGVKS